MFQANIVHSLLRGLDPIHQKSISLTPGQIFNGKILKLYPGQLASLQLGGLTLTAKLEAALTVGSRYWFQVQPGEGLPVLKVLEGSTQNEKPRGRESENILRQLGLSYSKQSEMLVKYLAKEEIPFTRAHVIRGAETLQNVGMLNEKGLSIIKLLVERNLPITPATFSAMNSVITGQGLVNQLQELSTLIQPLQGKEPLLQQFQQLLQSILNEANVKVDRHQILDTLKTFLTENATDTQQRQSQVELQKLGVIDKQSPEQLLANVKVEVTRTPADQLKQIWPTLTKAEVQLSLNKGEVGELLSKIVLEKGVNGERTIQQLLTLFSSSIVKNSENLVFPQSEDSLGKQLVSLINRIGYQHERDAQQFLQQRSENSETFLMQLKAILVKTQQQVQMPPSIQDKVESILNRITGQQLLSVNQEGPITNHAVMVPLKLLGGNSDLTIQWEGKKENDGKLNPDHCRILFYLNLANLKETIIDVQIQNRVVSLHVINEQQKPAQLINALQPYLTRALNDLNYQLTSVKWTNPIQSSKSHYHNGSITPVNKYYQSQRPYQGVDIRI